MPSPPPRENFLAQPDVTRGAYDYSVEDEELLPGDEVQSHG
jgi:hypothetical protein